MNIRSSAAICQNYRENMLQLRKELLAVEEDRLHGSKGYCVDEVAARMRHAIWEAVTHETAVKTTAF